MKLLHMWMEKSSQIKNRVHLMNCQIKFTNIKIHHNPKPLCVNLITNFLSHFVKIIVYSEIVILTGGELNGK